MPSDIPYHNSICGLTSLTLLFGPEVIKASKINELTNVEELLGTMTNAADQRALIIGVPTSVTGFIQVMEQGCEGAVILTHPNEKSKIGHVIGVIPSWKFKEVGHTTVSEREYLVADVNTGDYFYHTNEEGLAQLYASALYPGDSHSRTVFVLYRKSDEE